MPESKVKNLSASISQKLLNPAQEGNDDYGLVLTKHGLEKMLFRLSKSEYRGTISVAKHPNNWMPVKCGREMFL